jgi:hypothetical protein
MSESLWHSVVSLAIPLKVTWTCEKSSFLQEVISWRSSSIGEDS